MMVFLGNARSMAMNSAKMRIPLIKFRYGHNREAGSHVDHSTAQPQHGVQRAQPGPIVQHATNDTQLPHRFHRQPISEEEIEYINRGGPA